MYAVTKRGTALNLIEHGPRNYGRISKVALFSEVDLSYPSQKQSAKKGASMFQEKCDTTGGYTNRKTVFNSYLKVQNMKYGTVFSFRCLRSYEVAVFRVEFKI